MKTVRLSSIFHHVIALLLTGFIVSCGGGGGGGGTPEDKVPDAFSFTAQTELAYNQVVESNEITVSGINAAAAMSVAGGEYSIDGAPYSATATTVTTGKKIKLRVTAGDTFNVTKEVTLTIGGIVGKFSTTTIVSEDTTPDAFTFPAKTEALMAKTVESDEITISGFNFPAAISIAGGEYAIGTGAFTSTAGTITNGQTVKVRLTAASAINTPAKTTLTIGGVAGKFTATTHTADSNGLFTGTGTVNGATPLAAVKGIIHQERFMLVKEGTNAPDPLVPSVLYDGQIESYAGTTFTAKVTVYYNGLNSPQQHSTTTATGTIDVMGKTVTLDLTGTGYGHGTISLTYSNLYERDATYVRFKTGDYPFRWLGRTNTIAQADSHQLIYSNNDVEDFTSSTVLTPACTYVNAKKNADSNFNVYSVAFNSENTGASKNCDHIGVNFSGFATVVDGGMRGTDGIMWFMTTNGIFSNFSILEYQTK